MAAANPVLKKVIKIHQSSDTHWVGDGFPVQTVFAVHHQNHQGFEIDPFLLLDYMAPHKFESSKVQKGVEYHPHRGFETVSVLYQGETTHSDNKGNKGTIKGGDVQWMTAGRGILHEEMHSKDFTAKGGIFESVQLWVNLPAKHKMTEPKYQDIVKANISVVNLPNHNGIIRIIAGEYENTKGPAKTFTPVNVWDVKLNKGADITFDLTDGYNTLIFVIKGSVLINDESKVPLHNLVAFEKLGNQINIKAAEESTLLFLHAQPLNEPVVASGPFVMNTREEILQAKKDFHNELF